jgi:catechol 2,3-dioxygenase-like lactoylglutathione lyase family enzyme
MPLEGVVLDHVAVAVEAWAEAWPRYVVDFGGEWASGGLNVGFGPAQLRYANGARLEVLQPWQSEANPFLRRFLDRNGPGPHHLTFKVPDIVAALDAARDAGFAPVSVDLSDSGWKEAFLHPRQAGGIVVQLAQAAGSWEAPPPEGFPTARPASPAALLHVTHAVSDLDGAVQLYSELLGGEVAHHDVPEGAGWEAVTIRWTGPLDLRIVAPSGAGGDLRHWLGGRPGRLHHLAFSQAGARANRGAHVAEHAVPGWLPGDAPLRLVLEPDANLGTRVVVLEPSGDTGTAATDR